MALVPPYQNTYLALLPFDILQELQEYRMKIKDSSLPPKDSEIPPYSGTYLSRLPKELRTSLYDYLRRNSDIKIKVGRNYVDIWHHGFLVTINISRVENRGTPLREFMRALMGEEYETHHLNSRLSMSTVGGPDYLEFHFEDNGLDQAASREYCLHSIEVGSLPACREILDAIERVEWIVDEDW